MEEKSQYVQEVFTEIADDYDQMNDKMTWGMLKGWQKIVMQKTQLQTGDKGLDVCCGTGEMTFQQRQLVGPAGEVVGLDFTQSMLDVANAKLEEICKGIFPIVGVMILDLLLITYIEPLSMLLPNLMY